MIEKNGNNVFEGETAVIDFLHPKNLPLTPLVELPKALNPFYDDGVRIYAKLMFLTPLLNIKLLPALNMIEAAKGRGTLQDIGTLVENSSGNMVFSLALVARFFGIGKVVAVVSHSIARGKLKMLQLAGIEVVVNKEPAVLSINHPESSISKAKLMGREHGWHSLNQYGNEDNPAAHEKYLASQLDDQIGDRLTILSAGVGSTGTVLGLSRYFKQKDHPVKILAVKVADGQSVPGMRHDNSLSEVSLLWREASDVIEEAKTNEAYEQSLTLLRSGIMAGPSAGSALAGLINFLRKSKMEGRLDELKNKKGEVVAVFVCGDTPLPYIDDYFKNLGADKFLEIKNEELLKN